MKNSIPPTNMKNELNTITPVTNKDKAILTDLQELQNTGTSLNMLRDDINDDPSAYPYTEYDLDYFIATYNPAI